MGDETIRQSAGKQRLAFLDNLKGVVILLVILDHVLVGYMEPPPPAWYVVDSQRTPLFRPFIMLLDIFVMPIMFFVAGYFTLPALMKRGMVAFWQNKLRRIVFPWVAGVLVFAPMITYMRFVSRLQKPPAFFSFWPEQFFNSVNFNQAHFWFLGDLAYFFLIVSLAYCIWPAAFSRKPAPTSPTTRFFLLFGLFIAAMLFVVTLFVHPDDWYNRLYIAFQHTRILPNFCYFLLGVYAWRNLWFAENGYIPRITAWLAGVILTLGPLVYCRMAFETSDTLPIRIGLALSHSGFCLTSIFCLFAVFHHFIDPGPAWLRRWSSHSFTIYFMHQLVLLPTAYLVQNVAAPIWLKASSVILVTAILSFIFAEYIWQRISPKG